MKAISLVLSLLVFAACTDKQIDPPPHTQLVVVLSQDWEATTGQLYLLNWQSKGWSLDLQSPVNLGRNGLGLGLGRYELDLEDELP